MEEEGLIYYRVTNVTLMNDYKISIAGLPRRKPSTRRKNQVNETTTENIFQRRLPYIYTLFTSARVDFNPAGGSNIGFGFCTSFSNLVGCNLGPACQDVHLSSEAHEGVTPSWNRNACSRHGAWCIRLADIEAGISYLPMP